MSCNKPITYYLQHLIPSLINKITFLWTVQLLLLLNVKIWMDLLLHVSALKPPQTTRGNKKNLP